ncbi:ABC transporter substrate-binding protein [Pseudotabrizicola alkalilacus]|uniref:ABC transporter substrate-binding protein n=1 Tax=Pseudotabrizicola alkalilacus TaxID=2305252 RepID=A0A411YWZ5_9RHOB|nr:ABC transporter substrate-binding protein [Pseudotabrizicola alkalilacus]RGP35417.1 ABC transporter substrate-binding protein [Pseudotabrizicola alkalilacus]
MKHLLLTTVATLALAGAAQAQSTLNVSLNADLRTNDPGVNRDGNSDGLLMHILEGLVGARNDMSIAPMLAEKVDVSDDFKTFTFVLRDGLKFHNGASVTSAEFLWSWNRYMDPATQWSCRADFDGSRVVEVTSVETPDPKTVVMTIAEPSPVFLALLARPECGQTAILHPDSVDDSGKYQFPIGTGPFKWQEWRKGEYVQLEAFADYVSPSNEGTADGLVGNKDPLVGFLRYMVVPDGATVIAGIRSGAIHFGSIAAEQIDEFRDIPTLQLLNVPTGGHNILYFQTRNTPLDNVEIRRAIAEAIDLDQLVAAASNGTGTPNMSLIPVGSSWYSDIQAQRPAYDPESAKARLAAAGYKGEPITIKANRRGNVPSYPAAIVAQAMLQAVGINAQIEVLDFAIQTDQRREGLGQISSVSVTPRLDPSFTYTFFIGNKDDDPSRMWEDPRAIELMDRSYVETDPDKRQQIFDELHLLMMEEVPSVFIYNMVYNWLAPKSLTGMPVWESYPRLWNVALD